MSLHGLAFLTAFDSSFSNRTQVSMYIVDDKETVLKSHTHWQPMMFVKRPTSLVFYVSLCTGGIFTHTNTSDNATVLLSIHVNLQEAIF